VSREPEYTVEVVGRREIADRVVELTLRTYGDDMPSWRPGAHIDVMLTSRRTRQYSLCGDPGDRRTLTIAVLREHGGGRGGSAFVHNMVKLGDRLRIRGPRNNFRLCDAQRYLFVAGGIGITPLLPMIRAVAARGGDWSLVYGGRNRASMAYLPELEALSAHGTVEVRPQNETGLLDLDALLGIPQHGTQVYCCGPESLLAAVERHCAAWPSDALRVERFAAKPIDPRDLVDERFEVKCARSGVTVQVPPGRSILETLDRVGVFVDASCWEGVCGMCETGVLEGIPEHRDYILTPQERLDGQIMMICCSRACGPRLVLDL
jgi:ferredoxin-NADP reductase